MDKPGLLRSKAKLLTQAGMPLALSGLSQHHSGATPKLYGLCIGLVVLHSVIFLSCCCCSVCGILQVIGTGGGTLVHAGDLSALIAQLTKEKPFKQSEDNIPTEDAVCAVCLGEYEEDELLSPCVDKWLLSKKECPMCKNVSRTVRPQAQNVLVRIVEYINNQSQSPIMVDYRERKQVIRMLFDRHNKERGLRSSWMSHLGGHYKNALC
ncbi:hypothetical protein PROFUN_00411 [Planoprotostelium fungivorum]|uniref:RING-type domain-containing protein n=1 Tax=Planoprotostelium fungivorum TaxID=1890364 RepID=A0A2P6NYA9_9EUKA|nr:hypothetical protein PROFUN_00411 [Planoprotostelium fungivorum]